MDMSLPFLPTLLMAGASGSMLKIAPVDLLIIVIYFGLVLTIGVYLKKHATTGKDFFEAGKKMTAWVAGLSFISANLGSLETMGYAAATYQYGMTVAHAYYIAAIPAIIFLALVMLPFYYISKTHSVPGYLKLRYGEPARAVSSITFAVMTILMSGINMYSMAIVMKVILGWDINFSIWVSSLTVALYVMLGGLLSAIFNEVLQFFLIWFGALLIPILGLIEVGGWGGMVAGISCIDYYDASDNVTTTFQDFKDKQWYKFRARVTPAKIEVWVDDQQVVDVKREGRKISIRDEVDLCRPLGFSSWVTIGGVKNIRIRKLEEVTR